MFTRAVVSVVTFAAFSGAAFALDVERAKALRDEGSELLRRARGPGGDVVHGSHEAIAKFEEAAALLADAREDTAESELLQDINSLIFWTRRTTPMDMSAIFGGSPSSGAPADRGGSTTHSPAPTPKPVPTPTSRPSGRNTAAEAAAALGRAEEYAQSHPDRPLICAARFFEVADIAKNFNHIAFKAISRAQEFQRLAKDREAARGAESNLAALSSDQRQVVEGDRAYAEKEFDEAARRYAVAIAVKAAPERYRKLGHAHFERAQQIRVEYTTAWIAFSEALRAKKRQPRSRTAAARANALFRATKVIAARSKQKYSEAETAFGKALQASGGLDIDAELHMALANVVRTDRIHRVKAARILERILRTYHDKLETDEERTLYALAEMYAGPKLVKKTWAEIARKAGVGPAGGAAASSRGGGEDGAGGPPVVEQKPPAEMSDGELRKAVAELRKRLNRDEIRLDMFQTTGRYNKKLLDTVNAEKKRLKKLEAEADRRGL